MKKLLFIDDNTSTLDLYSRRFKTEYEVEVVSTGHSGLKKAAEWLPDLVILDVILSGGMNGFDVLRELKQNNVTRGIQVMMLTNLDGQESDALAAGASACLVKSTSSLDEIAKTISGLTS